MSESSQFNKRLLLVRLYKLLILVSFIGLLTPFLLSLTVFTEDSKKDNTTKWIVSIPIKNFPSGKIEALSWKGGLFWVYKRTDKDIRSLSEARTLLRDAVSAESDQPTDMANNNRSASELFFVFVPIESKRGCQIRLYDEESGIKFTEPCFGSKYDAAGRIYKNSGHKDQKNLSVPMHVIENGMLKIAVWIKRN